MNVQKISAGPKLRSEIQTKSLSRELALLKGNNRGVKSNKRNNFLRKQIPEKIEHQVDENDGRI